MNLELERLIKISTLRDVEIKLRQAQLENFIVPDNIFELLKEVEKTYDRTT